MGSLRVYTKEEKIYQTTPAENAKLMQAQKLRTVNGKAGE
jgi:hypothetical protein